MKPPLLLCYNLSGEKSKKIQLLAMMLKIRTQVVHKEEYHQTLAVLCGYEPSAVTLLATEPAQMPDSETFEDEMLVLSGFPNELLSQFLSGFRQGKIPPVTLKAILTETNRQWDSIALHTQLAAEHEAMSKGLPPEHEQQ